MLLALISRLAMMEVVVKSVRSSLSVVRSEGPAVNSPVRQGGELYPFDPLGLKGRHKFMPHLLRSGNNSRIEPALTDGAIDYRSFGPNVEIPITPGSPQS